MDTPSPCECEKPFPCEKDDCGRCMWCDNNISPKDTESAQKPKSIWGFIHSLPISDLQYADLCNLIREETRQELLSQLQTIEEYVGARKEKEIFYRETPNSLHQNGEWVSKNCPVNDALSEILKLITSIREKK